jgi:hypothetical protein
MKVIFIIFISHKKLFFLVGRPAIPVDQLKTTHEKDRPDGPAHKNPIVFLLCFLDPTQYSGPF